MRGPIFLMLLLAGCAGQTPDTPSLLPRAIETRSDAEPVRDLPPVHADAALDSKIAHLAADVAAAIRAHDAAMPGVTARLAVARAAHEGSEAWLDGQAALGTLGQARSAIDTALAGLESLAIERARAGDLPYPALDAAISTAQAASVRATADDVRLRVLLPG